METKNVIKKLKKAGFRYSHPGKKHDWYIRGDDREQIPRHTRMDDNVAKDILKKWGLK